MRRKIFKIGLLGDGASGKTAMRHRFLGDGFKQSYSMIIGHDIAVKRINLDGEEIIIQIYDYGGQIRFQGSREIYHKGTLGALLVFDITRPPTFENIPHWITELMDNNKHTIVPLTLVGNKTDLRISTEGCISYEQGNEYAQNLSDWCNFEVPYFETSALSGDNVEDVFHVLVRNIEYSLGY